MGLDLARWQEGFDSEQEIFKFIQSCKFFRPSFFARTHENSILDAIRKKDKKSGSFEEPVIWNLEARKRIAERPMLRHWIEYVATMPLNSERIDTSEIKTKAIEFFKKEDELHAIQ